MFERFTPEARVVVMHAQDHARRLGHRYIACEHVLLAVTSATGPAVAVLRERGVTPDQVEEQIVRQVGLGASAGLFAGLNRDALATIGIDLDIVRARIEGAFGADALTKAALRTQRGRAMSRRRRIARTLRRARRRGRPQAPVPRPPQAPVPGPPQATGRYRADGPLPTGHLPFTPRAKKCLETSLREALAMHDKHIGVEHLALGLLAADGGQVPPILAALHTSAPVLRAIIREVYRKAS